MALILFFLAITHCNSQQNNTFYLMHDVPQANLLNPAVQIKCKWFVGFPLLTSTQLNYSNSTFSFNEIFATSGGSASLDIGSFYENIRKTNLVSTELHLDLISIGYRRNEYYFNFNIAEKINIALTYPGSIMELAWKGNSQFPGETAEFNNLRTHSVYYREYSLGVSKVWDTYNIIGVRAKLLFGKANVYSGKSEMSLYTNPNTFDLHVEGDLNVNTSFPLTINQDDQDKISGTEIGDIDIVSFLMNGKNKGFALDLGWIHKYTEDITFSASLSWSYLNNTYKNIGLGLAWYSRGLQFHMISDNVLGIIKPLDTRILNLRFGFSFLFGCPKNKEEEEQLSNPYDSMNKGNCYWAKRLDKNYKKIKKKKKKRINK